MKTILKNIEQLLISFDQCLNVLFSMIVEPKTRAWADETFSAHCYRCRNDSNMWYVFYKIVNMIFFWQSEDHCKSSYESEVERKHSPKSEK